MRFSVVLGLVLVLVLNEYVSLFAQAQTAEQHVKDLTEKALWVHDYVDSKKQQVEKQHREEIDVIKGYKHRAQQWLKLTNLALERIEYELTMMRDGNNVKPYWRGPADIVYIADRNSRLVPVNGRLRSVHELVSVTVQDRDLVPNRPNPGPVNLEQEKGTQQLLHRRRLSHDRREYGFHGLTIREKVGRGSGTSVTILTEQAVIALKEAQALARGTLPPSVENRYREKKGEYQRLAKQLVHLDMALKKATKEIRRNQEKLEVVNRISSKWHRIIQDEATVIMDEIAQIETDEGSPPDFSERPRWLGPPTIHLRDGQSQAQELEKVIRQAVRDLFTADLKANKRGRLVLRKGDQIHGLDKLASDTAVFTIRPGGGKDEGTVELDSKTTFSLVIDRPMELLGAVAS